MLLTAWKTFSEFSGISAPTLKVLNISKHEQGFCQGCFTLQCFSKVEFVQVFLHFFLLSLFFVTLLKQTSMILGRSLFCSHALWFGLSSCHSTHSRHCLKQYFIMVPSPRDLLTAQFCVSGRKAVSSLSALALQFPLYMLLKFLCWGVQLSQRQVNRLWHIYYWSDSVLLMRTHSFTELIKSVFLLLVFYRKTFSK